MRTTLVQFVTQAHEAVEEFCAVLPAAAREETGTPERWSAKDLLVHIAVWKERLAQALAATLRGEPATPYADLDVENATTWQQHSRLTFDEARKLLESAQAHLVEEVSASREEDLADAAQRAWQGLPLWKGIVMNSFWHPTLHLAAFWLRRGEPENLNEWIERAAQQLSHLEATPAWQAKMVYDLACYYALTAQKAKAVASLREALRRDPGLTVWSRQDTDLAALHGDATYEALVEAK